MKKTPVIAVFLMLLAVSDFYPSDSLSSAEFFPKAELAVKGGYGAKAVVKKLRLDGLKGKTVMLQFLLHDTKKNLTVYTLKYVNIDKDSFIIDETVLEISDPEAITVLGEGSFQLYAIFQVVRMDNTEVLAAVRVVKEIKIELKKDPKDTAQLDELKKWHTDKLKELEQTYGIDILYGDFKGGYKVKEAGSFQNITVKSKNDLIEDYFPALIEALKRFPPEFIKKSGIKGVVFTEKIIFLGQPVGGHFDVSEKLIFITLSSPASYVSHAFAHEYCHYLDNTLPGHGNMEQWQSLNTPGFQYKNIPPDKLLSGDLFSQHPAKGFLNGYCMYDPYNDKAEVFAAYMTPAEYKKASALFADDPYLKKKFEHIRWELKSVFAGFPDYYDPEK
ncbi:MAG: hypothetical protein A2Y33_03240 [Spirochaetes bacterium GWF1_51_8]|nr:MAG: hypothetical protein A2Y33_03240 [Spirochaetes bacterium GWF1_51_8]